MFLFFISQLVELCHIAGKNLNHLSIYISMQLNTDITIFFCCSALGKGSEQIIFTHGKLIMCKHILVFSLMG